MPGAVRDYSSLFVKYEGTPSKFEASANSYTTPELPEFVALQETAQDSGDTERKPVKTGLAALTSEYSGNYSSGSMSISGNTSGGSTLTSGGKELASTTRRAGSYEDSENGKK
jgi:hypothetical protein